jgi:hypothetical protein
MAMNQAFSSFAKPSMFGDQAQNIGQAQSQFTQQGTSPFGFGGSKDGFGSFMNNFGSFGNNFGGAFNNGFTTPQYNMFGAFLGGGMGGAFQQPAPQQNIAGGFLPENFDAQAHLNNPLYQQNFNPDGSRVAEPSLARPGAPNIASGAGLPSGLSDVRQQYLQDRTAFGQTGLDRHVNPNIASTRARDRMEIDQPAAGQGGNLLDAFRQAQQGQRLFYT